MIHIPCDLISIILIWLCTCFLILLHNAWCKHVTLNPQFENSNKDRRIYSHSVLRLHVWEPVRQRVGHTRFSLSGNSQATWNGAQTAIVFARQSKMHILKSSGFWFYNIITHCRGYPGIGMQKSNQNWKVEAKNREWNRTVIIAINHGHNRN